MTKVLFINSQTGFAAGLSGNIFKTTDQGKTWSQTDNISDGTYLRFLLCQWKYRVCCRAKGNSENRRWRKYLEYF